MIWPEMIFCNHFGRTMLKNPTIINIIFKILHVSLDKKSLFSAMALCLVKLFPVAPHSYYIGAEYEHVEKEKTQLFSTRQQCGKWNCSNVSQNDSLFLDSLLLSHHLECEK